MDTASMFVFLYVRRLPAAGAVTERHIKNNKKADAAFRTLLGKGKISVGEQHGHSGSRVYRYFRPIC